MNVIPGGKMVAHEETKQEVITYSLEEISARLENPQSVTFGELLRKNFECCGDGRKSEAVMGVFGGPAGEILLFASVIEDEAGRELTQEEVDLVVAQFIEKMGGLYMHSDIHGAEHVLEAVGQHVEHDNLEAFFNNPPEEIREQLLEALSTVDGIGCGHIKQMLDKESSYGVSPGLIKKFIRSFFTALWKQKPGDDRVKYDTITVEKHEEGAVVNIKLDTNGKPITDETLVPVIPPNEDGRQVFMISTQVSAALREQKFAPFMRGMAQEMGISLSDTYLEKTNAKGDFQFGKTAEKLAKGRPVYEVTYDENLKVTKKEKAA